MRIKLAIKNKHANKIYYLMQLVMFFFSVHFSFLLLNK